MPTVWSMMDCYETPAKKAKMQKTPVSILQEMMVKKGGVPNYELIHDGGGSHENTFTYRVLCEGLIATGTGRCKKDAKHAAASNMLETIVKHNGFLPLPASPVKSPVRAPPPLPKPEPYVQDPNGPFVNAIGALQDLCADNDLQDPAYNTISDIGPPHARIFTMQCTVASFKEEGISTTKKQAKHLAAKKMLERITEVLDDASKSSVIPLLKRTGTLMDDDMAAANERAKNLYMDQRGPLMKKMNLGVKLADFHDKLRSSYTDEVRKVTCDKLKELETLMGECEGDEDGSTFDVLRGEFQELLESLTIELCKGVINGIDGEVHVLSLDLTPEIVEVAWGEGPQWKIELEAYVKMIKTLQCLLL